MNIRIPFVATLLLLVMTAGAQDKIYKKDGKVIDAKVKMVGERTVLYKRHDNPDGPEYTILRKEVERIVYENGTEDGPGMRSGKNNKASQTGKYEAAGKNYGDNIFSIIPGAYTAQVDGTINDVGLGLCYERLLDEKGHFGVVLPVLLNFSSDKDFINHLSYSSGGYLSTNKSYTSFLFAPGIKFYPARKNEKVRYAIGGSFFVLLGKEPYEVYDYNYVTGTGLYYPSDHNYAMYGFMIYNSINVSPSPHLFLELFLATGVPVSDNRYRDGGVVDNLFAPIMQFGLKVGGRK